MSIGASSLQPLNLRAQKPRLRTLDIKHHQEQGRGYLHLSDPLRLTEHALLVPQPWGALLALCNGEHDVPTMNRLLQAQYGVQISIAQIEEIVEALDEVYMLENERSLAVRRQAVMAYRHQPFRPAALAGGAYPAEPEQLRGLLDHYLANAKEGSLPQRPAPDYALQNGALQNGALQNGALQNGALQNGALQNGATQNGVGQNGTGPTHYRGLLSPHIDYARGGAVYADVWMRAAEAAQQADLVILFGTDHYGNDPFTLTRQHYATPYGIMPTATDVVDALVENMGEEAAYAGELRHRGEHSLELVAVWLHHMRAGQPCELVPILTGGFHRYIYNGGCPAEDALIEQVLDTLTHQCQNRHVLVVASGDLAHVGPAFGGDPLQAAARQRLQQADQKLLEKMQLGDANGFFEEIRQVRDGNNVCGVSPIYLTMRLLEKMGGAVHGDQVSYAACPADAYDTSVVTVGGVLFA